VVVPPRQLRILHTESSTGWGGQEIRILTEARGMIDRGHQVTLVTPGTAEIHAAAVELGIPVCAVPIHRKRWRDFAALRRWCRSHIGDFDVVNTHSSTDSWLIALVAQTCARFPPIVRTRHVSTAINNSLPTRWLYARATAHIVTTGEALRQQLHRDNAFALRHMTSVPTGIDLDFYRPLDKLAMRARLGVADRPTIGTLATLRDWKGHDDLLDAFAQLRARQSSWQLLIVGDGPRRAYLEQRVAQHDLSGHVRFTGNQRNVPEWLATFDVFAFPSYGDEGVPQGIMQAMACGLAVVSTPIGGITEAVEAEVTGLLVDPRNPVMLSAALERLMTDTPLRQRMGAAGIARARQRFDLASMLDDMEAIFLRCAGRN
jgi:glycosyltransferase involved in cell wall biosynthesis